MKMMRNANLQGTIMKNKGVRHDRDSVRLVSDSKIILRSFFKQMHLTRKHLARSNKILLLL